MYFLVKTAVFQPQILTNHHGNHFHGFMALVEEEKSKSFYKVTYFSKYHQVANYYSKLKFMSFHHSIDEAQWFVASSLKCQFDQYDEIIIRVHGCRCQNCKPEPKTLVKPRQVKSKTIIKPYSAT